MTFFDFNRKFPTETITGSIFFYDNQFKMTEMVWVDGSKWEDIGEWRELTAYLPETQSRLLMSEKWLYQIHRIDNKISSFLRKRR